MPPEPPTRAAQLLGPSSGRLLPSLELAFADGRPAPLWDYRGRGPLVVFLHEAPDCARCRARLAELAAAHAGYREVGAQALAVGRGAPPGLPYPALLDPAGRLAAALGLPLPALLVVGRTGEVWAAWGGAHDALPDTAEIAGWLEYALSECRECFCCELAWPEAWVRGERS
ncbi:MAG TPA: redoxin domain-containing protein [Chloroflexota bacterium]|jgi:peroxiredoxin